MRIKSSKREIYAAESIGTKFLRCDLPSIIDAFKEADRLLEYYMFSTKGWDAIDFDAGLFGSEVIEDELYICITDGKYILDEVDPEEALTSVGVSRLQDYIQEADPKDILDNIGKYELSGYDLNECASYLMYQDYNFLDIVKAFKSEDLL